MCCVRVPALPLLAAISALSVAGCAGIPLQSAMETDDRLCLARVMFFESLRSSYDGMLAVGTVVMNRIDSGRYPGTVCAVVGQRNQFAPGALTSPFRGQGRDLALKAADAVLSGKRLPGMQGVMFFHTAGYTFPYHNMRYVLVAGGNAFYYKSSTREMTARAYTPEPAPMPMPGPMQSLPPAMIASNQQIPEQDSEPNQTSDEAAKPGVDFQSFY